MAWNVLMKGGAEFCNLSNKTERASNEAELTSQLTDPASPKKTFWGKNSKLSELELNMRPCLKSSKINSSLNPVNTILANISKLIKLAMSYHELKLLMTLS